MNGRRMPLWPRLIAGIAVIALLAVALLFMGRLFLGALNLLRTDGGPTQPDPQFAEPAETAVPPMELTQQGEAAVGPDDDPSARWVQENQTPVDKTADELSREAGMQP